MTSTRTTQKRVASESQHRLREIEPDNRQDLAAISQLHMQLLDCGPMARLGELFVREICYGIHLRDDLMRVALYEVDKRPVGFIAYTPCSITFHRTAFKSNWVYTAWVLAISIVIDPRRILRLFRAVKIALSRRAEKHLGHDPLGEIVSLGVLPEYLTPQFVRRTDLRVSEELVIHALSYFRQARIGKVRMIVDADNKPVLFLYHRLGAVFEQYEQGGEPRVQVWFDLNGNFPGLPSGDAEPGPHQAWLSSAPG